MQYKTIILRLLEQRPDIQAHLQQNRTLLATLERLATELKTSHEAWKEDLCRAQPGRDESQIASEALELALDGLAGSLLKAPPAEEGEPFPLDEAMAFLRRHTPPA